MYYSITINIAGFLLFAIDKRKAQKNKYRISESCLLFVSFIGGALGSILAMGILKHKNNKMKFAIGLPMLLIFNSLAFYYLRMLFR